MAKTPSSTTVVILVIFLSPWFCCCALPSAGHWLTYGRFPVGDLNQYHIRDGMTRAEVRAEMGQPHAIVPRDDGEIWHYHADPLGIGIYSIRFGQDGRVNFTWI